MFTPQGTDGQWFSLSLGLRKKKNEENGKEIGKTGNAKSRT
jgi:hypothetical protein